MRTLPTVFVTSVNSEKFPEKLLTSEADASTSILVILGSGGTSWLGECLTSLASFCRGRSQSHFVDSTEWDTSHLVD